MSEDADGTPAASRFRLFLPALLMALFSAGVTVLPLSLLAERLFTSKRTFDFSNPDAVLGMLFLGIPYYALATFLFSIVPVSLVAAALMWLRVRSLAVFAIAGALAPLLPLAVLVPVNMWLSVFTDPDMSGFFAAGAIGGLSARLYLNRAERQQRVR